MELSRGICVLCTNNTKVVLPPQAEDITNLLWDILENKIDIRKFDDTSTTLKVCPSCLHDILQVAEYKQNLDEFSESTRSCSLCRDYEHLISIADWKHFNVLLQNVTSQKIKKCSVCVHCIKFLELLERIKVNFLNRYPQLALKKTARDRKYDDLKSALKHLKPLKYSNFNIEQYKGDQKLLKQVAFVKLSITNQTTKDGISSQPRKFKKLRLSSLNDCDSLRGSSPKPSFFKIKLKSNTTKPKTNKVISEKVTEHKDTLKVPPSNKELVVNIFKMDFNKMNQTTAASDSDGDEQFRTPTKASLKMMPEDSLSSRRKRKSVTFAEDLDVEITDGISSRKDNSDGSPLKSSLKKNDSPTADLFKICSLEDSSDDDTELITNIVNKINGNGISSDDEMDVYTTYGQGKTGNIKILDTPNKLIGNTREDYSDNKVDKHFDNERANSKKRKIIDVNSEVGDDGNIETNDKKLKNPNKKKKHSDFENMLNENDYNAVASNDIYGSKSGKKQESRVSEHSDNDLLKNMVDKGHTSEPEEKADILDSELESINSTSDETTTSTDKTLKPKTLFSHFDSVSISSDSSKEDTIITLGQYKKIRKSAETNDKSDDSSEDLLGSLCIESDDVSEQLHSLENDFSITNNSSLIRDPRKNMSEVRANEENLTDQNKTYEESETKTDKVSENDSEQGDIQNANSLLKDTSQLSESPVCDGDHKVVSTGPNIDNEYTVSDRQNVESGNHDTEQQHMESSVDAEAVIENSCVTQVVVESNETNDNCSTVDLTHKQGISLSNAIQTGDNVDLNKLDTDSDSKISSSGNYVTSTGVDVLTDKIISTVV